MSNAAITREDIIHAIRRDLDRRDIRGYIPLAMAAVTLFTLYKFDLPEIPSPDQVDFTYVFGAAAYLYFAARIALNALLMTLNPPGIGPQNPRYIELRGILKRREDYFLKRSEQFALHAARILAVLSSAIAAWNFGPWFLLPLLILAVFAAVEYPRGREADEGIWSRVRKTCAQISPFLAMVLFVVVLYWTAFITQQVGATDRSTGTVILGAGILAVVLLILDGGAALLRDPSRRLLTQLYTLIISREIDEAEALRNYLAVEIIRQDRSLAFLDIEDVMKTLKPEPSSPNVIPNTSEANAAESAT